MRRGPSSHGERTLVPLKPQTACECTTILYTGESRVLPSSSSSSSTEPLLIPLPLPLPLDEEEAPAPPPLPAAELWLLAAVDG